MQSIGEVMKKILILLTFFNVLLCYANQATPTQKIVIAKYESEISKLIKSKKLPNENIFYLYLIAARDFHLEKIDDYYLSYLNKAKAIKTSEDKSEVYWRLINYHRSSGDLSTAKNLFSEWEEQDSGNEKVMKQAFTLLRSALYKDTKQSLSKEEIETLEKGPFSYRYRMSNLDQLIKSKKYAQALSLINPLEIDGEMISTIVRYDLLNRLVTPKGKNKLKCESTLEKYPKSQSYSIKICKSLLEFTRYGKVSKATLKETKTILENSIYKDDRFLYSALLDLK